MDKKVTSSIEEHMDSNIKTNKTKKNIWKIVVLYILMILILTLCGYLIFKLAKNDGSIFIKTTTTTALKTETKTTTTTREIHYETTTEMQTRQTYYSYGNR